MVDVQARAGQIGSTGQPPIPLQTPKSSQVIISKSGAPVVPQPWVQSTVQLQALGQLLKAAAGEAARIRTIPRPNINDAIPDALLMGLLLWLTKFRSRL